jgi:hypothetical protein
MTGTLAVSAADWRKFPADDASHSEMWVIVSDVVMLYVDSDDSVIEPPAAAFQVTAFRVVTADAAVVPAAPGSAVCSLQNTSAR